MVKIENPHNTLTMVAVDSSNRNTGTIKVMAKSNFAKKVVRVDSQISLSVCILSASSETWMPKASENASTIAMVNMPPITTSFDPENEC